MMKMCVSNIKQVLKNKVKVSLSSHCIGFYDKVCVMPTTM